MSELKLDEIYVFRGPTEACYMLSMRTVKGGKTQMVPHSEMKIVGDRGTTDAKILSSNTRGNLKLKGPHVTPYYYNNSGLNTELVDDKGWVNTSREGVVKGVGQLDMFGGAQIY